MFQLLAGISIQLQMHGYTRNIAESDPSSFKHQCQVLYRRYSNPFTSGGIQGVRIKNPDRPQREATWFLPIIWISSCHNLFS